MKIKLDNNNIVDEVIDLNLTEDDFSDQIDDKLNSIFSEMFDDETGNDLTMFTNAQMEAFKDTYSVTNVDEISDNADEKLVPAQFAPSASNTQPWYFTHNDDGSYDLYRVKLGRLRNRFYKKWNKIDTGIALAHLYVANKDSFRFFIKDNPKELKDCFYAGSFEI